MDEWARLNRLTKNNLLRLNVRNLNRYINTIPNNNKWNSLYKRLGNVRRIKYPTNLGLKQNRAAANTILYNHRHGRLHNGFPVTNKQAANAQELVRLIKAELARRERQKTRATARAMNAVNALWHKPNVGRGYARHFASVKHRW